MWGSHLSLFCWEEWVLSFPFPLVVGVGAPAGAERFLDSPLQRSGHWGLPLKEQQEALCEQFAWTRGLQLRHGECRPGDRGSQVLEL